MHAASLVALAMAACAGPQRAAPQRGAGAAQSADNSAAAQEVVQIEKQRVLALVHRDCDTQEAVLADDFLELVAGGVIRTKSQNVSGCRSGAIVFEHYVVTDLEARVDGDTAVLTGTADLAGTYRGEPFARRTRYLRVYVRRSGAWRCLAASGSPLSDAGAPGPR